MKYAFVTALVIASSLGCDSQPSDIQTAANEVDAPTSKTDENRIPPSVTPTMESALEVIATSSDGGAVSEAEELLQKQGVAALPKLASHMDDERIPPTKVPSLYQKAKNVSHTPVMSDYCYWMMQDIVLDTMFARVLSDFSPFAKDTAKDWIDERKSLSRSEFRRDAANGVLESLNSFIASNPDDAEAKEIQSFYEKQLIILDAVIAAEQKKNGVAKP